MRRHERSPCAHEIGIDPLDRIAHVRGDLRRDEAELFHFDLNDLGARRRRREDENERAECQCGGF